jgi:hypothetical protein
VALPAAAATATTDSFNLIQKPPHECHFEVELALPALPSLADTKKATVTLEDSEDGITFATIAALASMEVTGAGGAGAAAVIRKVRLPSDVRQYIRAKVAVEAAAGNNTAKSLTIALVF